MFADIGPQTRKLSEVRAGIRGVRQALDRGDCRDAAALLKLTEREKQRLVAIDANTQHWFDAAKSEFKTSCRVSFAAYKPEQIPRHVRLSPGSEARARRSAKKAATRVARRAAKYDPEDAPIRRRTRGWID